MELNDTVHNCRHGESVLEAGERCSTFLSLLGAQSPLIMVAVPTVGASLLPAGTHVSSQTLDIFLYVLH